MWLKSCTYLCLFYTNSDTVLSPRREPEYCIEFHSKPSFLLHVSELAVKLEDHWGVVSEHILIGVFLDLNGQVFQPHVCNVSQPPVTVIAMVSSFVSNK